MEQENDDFQVFSLGLEHSWGTGGISLEQKFSLLHETTKGGLIGNYDLRAGYEILPGLSIIGDLCFMQDISGIENYNNETSVGGGLSYNF
jgi:hypothetical protein